MAELLGLLLALAILAAVRLTGRLGEALWRILRAHCRLPRPWWRRGVRLRLARGRARRQEARIARLAAELDRTRLALRLAERRHALAAAGCPFGHPCGQDRFRRAKRAFALHFHPDRLHGMDRAEARLRRRVFRDFWSVLRQIEQG